MTVPTIIDQLIALDKELFLFLNGLHTPWLDPVMRLITETLFWLPFYIFLLFHIVKQHKVMSLVILLGITLTILLSDQITTGTMKPYFTRLRPSHEPSLEGLVHLVNGYKGAVYGFASSHAANTFGTAMFLYLLFRTTKPWIVWLFPWAALVSYTRIYLGVHYPADIVAGAAVGILCGWISFILYKMLRERIEKKKTPSHLVKESFIILRNSLLRSISHRKVSPRHRRRRRDSGLESHRIADLIYHSYLDCCFR